jgi:hypothetical protein
MRLARASMERASFCGALGRATWTADLPINLNSNFMVLSINSIGSTLGER